MGVLLAIGVCIPHVVFGMSVSPLSQTATVDPGDTITFDISITNDDAQGVSVSPGIVGVTIDEKTGAIKYQESTPLHGWLQPVDAVILSAGESERVSYTLVVPQFATPGVYYGAFVQSAKTSSGQIGVDVGLGSLITLYVSGDVVESVSVRQLSMEQDAITSREKSVFIELENEGNIHAYIIGDIVAKDQKGIELARTALPIDVVYAGMKRQEAIEFSLPEGAIGPVYVHVEGTYGLTQKTFGKKVTTWYVPKTLFVSAGVAAAIVVLFILFLLFRKKRVRI